MTSKTTETDGLPHANDTCPFCAQNIKALPLMATFRVLFNDRYKTLREDVQSLRDKIDLQFGERGTAKIALFSQQHVGATESWSSYIPKGAMPDVPGRRLVSDGVDSPTSTL